MLFIDRAAAGRKLAERLEHLRDEDVVVAGLPRGGVAVAAEVAQALGAPLDVILVRKLGVPRWPELAIGAIAESGVRVVDERATDDEGIGREALAEVERREQAELARRADRLRAVRPAVDLAGRTVVVIDDGIATGATAFVACRAARRRGAARVVVATPVASPGWEARLGHAADEYIALRTPPDFRSVGEWYLDFREVTDDEVAALLLHAGRSTGREEDVAVPAGDDAVPGHLTMPPAARGVVVVPDSSGPGGHGARCLVPALRGAGFATLALDLRTPAERADVRRGDAGGDAGSDAGVVDVELLAARLDAATRWLRSRPELRGLRIGYAGASTDAAAALWAAGQPGAGVAAVVSLAGRTELARDRLPAVLAPTLLVAGGSDPGGLRLGKDAAQRLRCPHRLRTVRGATDVCADPRASRVAAQAAAGWFERHLDPSPARRPSRRRASPGAGTSPATA